MGTIGTVVTPQMPKQVWQSEDGITFESEEECVAYEKVAASLKELYGYYDREEAEKKLGFESGFAMNLTEAFLEAKDLFEYKASFQRLADLLHGRVKLD